MQIELQTERTPEIGREQFAGSSLTCVVCPHRCELKDRQIGKCGIWHRDQGNLVNPFEGRCSLLSVEPIEKRPFFHYRPAKKYLAVGFYGCSFKCAFCQNFKISQTTDGPGLYKRPEELVLLARQKAEGIAFTFNEPTLYHSYIRTVCEMGADVVVKTNGFVNECVLDDLSGVSAWNVDIKGDDAEYKRTCGGELKPVLQSIEHLAGKSHLEVSYLIIPRMASDMAFHRHIRDFLADINPRIPVHILFFYPFHKMIEHGYNPDALFPIIDLFKERMRYTYVSNAFHSQLIGHRHTYCPTCDSLLVERLKRVRVVRRSCCGENLDFVAGR